MLDIILIVTYLGVAHGTGSVTEPIGTGSLGSVETPQDDCVVPMVGDVAVYSWTQDGCALGWSDHIVNSEYGNSTVSEGALHYHFGTCEASLGLVMCPWEYRDHMHGPVAAKSPKHCNVVRVEFIATGTQSSTNDTKSKEWAGVKLVDSRDYTRVIKSWTKPADGNDESYRYPIKFDDISPNICYRLIVQIGTTGHVEISDVSFGLYNPPKMLVDMDVKFKGLNYGNLPSSDLSCTQCDCREWDGKKYSQCRPITEANPCKAYCVYCESDGVTPLEGDWVTQLRACERRESKGLHIKIHDANFCLDGWNVWDFVEVNMRTCQSSNANQHWIIDQDGAIKVLGTNFCLYSPNRENGGEVQLWTCQDSNPNQKWTLDLVSGKIRLAGTSFCLDTPDRKDEGKVQIWECTDTPNQSWIIREAYLGSPNWEYQGHYSVQNWDKFIRIERSTGQSLAAVQALMRNNTFCNVEGAILFHAPDLTEPAYCAAPDLRPDINNDQKNDTAWNQYILHFDRDDQDNWNQVKGDLLLSSESNGGSDSNGDWHHTSLYTVGASYIYASSIGPTVVTDIRLQPTDASSVNCPAGYEKKSTVILTDGDSVTNKDNVKGTKLMALCLQKQTCDAFGQERSKYVSEVGAIVSGEQDLKNLNQTALPDGCEIIGYWHPTWAVSYTSGEKSLNTTAIYQCKSSCMAEMCASVKIIAMQKAGPPTIGTSPNAVGDNGDESLNGCTAWSSSQLTHSISDGETVTNSNEYTTDSSIESYFKTTLSSSVSVWAEAGFDCWGAESKVKTSFDISSSASSGFSSTMDKSEDTLHSKTTSALITESATMHLKPGEVTMLRTRSTMLNYQQKFSAYAQCLNKNGELLETKQISGQFKGRTHSISGRTEMFSASKFCNDPDTWHCVCPTDDNPTDDKQRRRLVDRLFGH